MRLPPVDKFRKPFIEPLGTMALFAAQADNALVELIALASVEPSRMDGNLKQERLKAAQLFARVDAGTASKVLRHFQQYAVSNPALLNDVTHAVNTYVLLRGDRNRAIHDAIEVGVFDDGTAATFQVGHPRKAEETLVNEVVAEEIADLACKCHELWGDLKDAYRSLVKHNEALLNSDS